MAFNNSFEQYTKVKPITSFTKNKLLELTNKPLQVHKVYKQTKFNISIEEISHDIYLGRLNKLLKSFEINNKKSFNNLLNIHGAILKYLKLDNITQMTFEQTQYKFSIEDPLVSNKPPTDPGDLYHYKKLYELYISLNKEERIFSNVDNFNVGKLYHRTLTTIAIHLLRLIITLKYPEVNDKIFNNANTKRHPTLRAKFYNNKLTHKNFLALNKTKKSKKIYNKQK